MFHCQIRMVIREDAPYALKYPMAALPPSALAHLAPPAPDEEVLSLVVELIRATRPNDPLAPSAPGGYVVKIQGQSYSLQIPWTQEQLDNLLDQIVRPGAAARTTMQEAGRALRDALLATGAWMPVEQRMQEALCQGRPVTLTIQSLAAEVHTLPWELLTDADNITLTLRPGFVLRRQWPRPEPTQRPAAALPRGARGRILFLHSDKGGRIPARPHTNALKAVCERAGLDFATTVTIVESASLSKLATAAKAATRDSDAITVVHILCHGAHEADGSVRMVWHGEDGGGARITGQDLALALAPLRPSLRLVILSACHAGDQGRWDNPLGSIAAALHRDGVPLVAASRGFLSPNGAVILANVLYEGLLVELRSAEAALSEARGCLLRDGGDKPDWAFLELLGQVSDNDDPDTRPFTVAPYQDLRAFGKDRVRFFFGRGREREALKAKVLAVAAAAPRFVAVVGASGTGKSSLVLAGLLTDLDGAASPRTHVVVRPGETPEASLWDALRASAPASGHAVQPKGPAEAIAVARELFDRRPVLLVVDQLEEIFTATPDAAVRGAYLQVLWALATDAELAITLVVTLRSDYLGRAGELVVDAEGRALDCAIAAERHRLYVTQLAPEQLHEVIVAPARLVGLRFDPGLPEKLRRDAGLGPGALPLLEYALHLLWEQRHGRRLTRAAYDRIGNVAGALERSADALVQRLSRLERRQAERALTQMVDPGSESPTGDTRRRAWLDEQRPRMPWARERFDRVIEHLVAARLVVTGEEVTSGDRGRRVWAEIAHEALIRSWGLLRHWVQEERKRAARREVIRWSVSVVGMLMVIFVVVQVWTGRREEAKTARLARAEAIVANARLAPDPLVAALLLAELGAEIDPPADALPLARRLAEQLLPAAVLTLGEDDGATTVAFSPDAQWILAATESGKILRLPLQGDTPPRKLATIDGEYIPRIAVSNDGKYFLGISIPPSLAPWPWARPRAASPSSFHHARPSVHRTPASLPLRSAPIARTLRLPMTTGGS